MSKFERKLKKLTAQLHESEELFIDMRQKYMDEKRDKEQALDTMREQMESEIERYKEEAELYKERVKIMQMENEKLVSSMRQENETQESMAIREIDIAETRFRAAIKEREETEKHLREIIADKKSIIDEMTLKLREVERQATSMQQDFELRERTQV